MGDFCCKGKPSCATVKSTLFAVSKDEWDTKEDTGKSMKNALLYCRMPKGTCQAKATSSSEEIKPIALAVIKLCLSEGISQSVTGKFCFKKKNFCSNLLKAFWVDLKAILGLVLPNHAILPHCHQGKLRLVFRCCYFVFHAYSCVVPTIQYYSTV